MSSDESPIPNCWEFMECSEKVRDTCPAYPGHGRECWKLTGTSCGAGESDMASYEAKILYCRNECEYYKRYLKDMYP